MSVNGLLTFGAKKLEIGKGLAILDCVQSRRQTANKNANMPQNNLATCANVLQWGMV